MTNLSPVSLDGVMLSDRFRLQRQLQRLQSSGRDSDPIEWEQWQANVRQSIERVHARHDSIPTLEFDAELPITSHREQIIQLVREYQTIVVCGETGSGKSTQLPKLCLEAGLGRRGMIGHTQPRRLAAQAVANRLAEELNTRVGEMVGFKIRFKDVTQPQTLVKVMTDGILLAETQRDRYLENYDAIIIDEAHERSLNIDFLLGYIRQLQSRRPDLKLIITSATIDPERFAEHFASASGPAPIVEVSGRTYPVEIRYAPPQHHFDDEAAEEQSQLDAIAGACDELIRGAGDILVFLPTERDIRITAKHLRGHYLGRKIDILPLYARLTSAEQNRIFEPHRDRRIVLATNVAESSLTVPGIHYVVDTGLARISRYAPRSKVQRLPIEAISQASANQRSGRCGRLGPGVCIRLYSEEDFLSRSAFTTPEIRRSDLASVLLQSLTLRLGPLDAFPLLDPPSAEAVNDAEKTLRELDAIDATGNLTEIGRKIGQLPCDPRVGRMLLEASARGCLPEVLVIAAAIETQDVRLRPAGQAPQADEAHAMFQDPSSDFLSYLRLWDFYEKLAGELGRSRLQKALAQRFLSSNHFREWSEVVRQLKEILHDAGMKVGNRRIVLPPVPKIVVERSDTGSQRTKDNRRSSATAEVTKPEGYDAIHQSLLTGLLRGVAHATETHEYRVAGGMTASLWPGSGLFRRKPKWIVAAEIIETTRRYARTVAEIDVAWVEHAALDLLKHSYSDPHWSTKSGSAMIYQRSTLYGLPIVSGRRVPLAPIDPTVARQLFIEHGLVGGEWQCREKFYIHNLELLADLNELAQRTRRREYIIDKYHLANFYQQRLPSEVCDLNSLRSFLKRHAGSEAEKGLWMQDRDFLPATENVPSSLGPSTDIAKAFPNSLRIGATEFPLTYQFEPGSEMDGLTITVPQAALRQISDERLGWLVPGLLEDKLAHLLRALPKSLRTHFVPVPEVAQKVAGLLHSESRDRPFSQVLCEQLSRLAGTTVTPSDFEVGKLPIHLRCLVKVIDDQGKVVASGRDVAELQATYAPADSLVAPEANGNTTTWKDRRIQQVDFQSLPEKVSIQRGGLRVAAFPTLVDVGDAVELRLVDNAGEAERFAVQGWMRLFAIKHHRSLRGQVANLPQLEQSTVFLRHLFRGDSLRTHLMDLIARIAFIEGKPPLRTADDFEVRNLRAIESISLSTQQVANWLPKFGQQVHQLRVRLEAMPSTWREVSDDLTAQVKQLCGEGFLKSTPWSWLNEFPRYFRAMELRLDKLKSGGLPKDRQLRAAIEQATQQYMNLRSQSPQPGAETLAKIETLRWMIEELRVSLFAQPLGTKIPISEKRIREYIGSLGS